MKCQGGYPGLFDMEGNASEVTADCDANGVCLAFGGDFYLGALKGCRTSVALAPSADYGGAGIRCCRDDP